MEILLSPSISLDDLSKAELIIFDFVKEVSKLYPATILLSGLHELLHLVDYTLDFGPLNCTNCFQFEEINRFNNIDCLKSYSIQIVAILDYYTSIKDINFELILSLYEKIRINYENLLRTNTNCILEYTDFIFNTLKIGNKSESIISI